VLIALATTARYPTDREVRVGMSNTLPPVRATVNPPCRWTECVVDMKLLHHLEAYRGVVACTTNLWTDLDEAALRRFAIKVEFRFLGLQQAMTVFYATYRGPIPSRADDDAVRAMLADLDNLTPGDFAAVARRERALGGTPTAQEFADAVAAETRSKPRVMRRLGFAESGSLGRAPTERGRSPRRPKAATGCSPH